MSGAYSFEAVGEEHFLLLEGWLRTPEIVTWWGDPEEELALLREDLHNPLMVMRIVRFEGRPFAYVQDYAVDSWPQPHMRGLPPGTRSLDTFIGEPDLIGRGHGGVYLRLRAARLIEEGAPAVVIDPFLDNERARSAYRRAGFRERGRFETEDGPVALMEFTSP